MRLSGCVLAAALLALDSTGCATIFRGTSQAVRFESEPPGATVTVGVQRGVTPVELRLKRRSYPEPLRIELDGRESYDGELAPHAAPGVIGITVFEGILLLPALIDWGSGAMWSWPQEVRATLPEAGQGRASLHVIREWAQERERIEAEERAAGIEPEFKCTQAERGSPNPRTRAKCEGME